MRRAYGETTQKIIQILKENGPMTLAEITKELGYARDYVSAVVYRMSKKLAKTPKRLYIKGYTYDMEGQRRYPRAIFDLGDKEDARKPKSDIKENKRRYRAKQHKINKMNFVFNLAKPRREYSIPMQ